MEIPITNRFISIDALRGIAAVSVILFHSVHSGIFGKNFGWYDWHMLDYPFVYSFSFGAVGVYLFFVISGFCIHLRWVKNKLKKQRETVREPEKALNFFAFWRRRFRRLYPAYLATIVLVLGILWWQEKLAVTAFFVWDLIAHLLMIHNFTYPTAYSLNPVFWTLAVEEQLYLAYFLLVFLRTKFGWKKTFAITVATRLAWFGGCFLLNRSFGIIVPAQESGLGNWCVWALGAISVEAAFGLIKLPKWCSSGWLSLVVLIVAGIFECVDVFYIKSGALHYLWLLIYQPLWGFGFFLLMNKIVASEIAGRIGGARHWSFLVRGLAVIGIFSYSLYLTHLIVFDFILPETHWTFKALASLIFAYLFYLAFEKPFLPNAAGWRFFRGQSKLKTVID